MEKKTAYERDRLEFEIRRVDRTTWRYFSKYHYLSDRLPGGHIELFGLFHDGNQVGFQCFANYVPHKKGTIKQMHSNRAVIHPDYVGLGLGIKMINITSEIMRREGYDVRAKCSSIPIIRSRNNDKHWKLLSVERKMRTLKGSNMNRGNGFRHKVTTYAWKYLGGIELNEYSK